MFCRRMIREYILCDRESIGAGAGVDLRCVVGGNRGVLFFVFWSKKENATCFLKWHPVYFKSMIDTRVLDAFKYSYCEPPWCVSFLWPAWPYDLYFFEKNGILGPKIAL